MPDVFTKKKRSQVMSSIRGRGNKGTELLMAALLRKNMIRGWRRHLDLPGRPDFSFRSKRLAVFVDGCFWHGCPRCYQAPKQNAAFWRRKIDSNRRRDRQVKSLLTRRGWAVLRIWECRLARTPDAVISKIRRALMKQSVASHM